MHSALAPSHLWTFAARPTRFVAAAVLVAVLLALTTTPWSVPTRTGIAQAPAASAVAAPHLLAELPLPAQAAIARGVGGREHGFWVRDGSRGLSAAGTGLLASFGAGHISVSAGGYAANLSLAAVGRGSTLESVPAVAPSATRNLVTYRHGSLQEWYANGPSGLEQGFRLASRPAATAAGPLTLALTLGGGLRARLNSDHLGLTLQAPNGQTVLRYAGLSASDVRGHAVATHLALRAGRVTIVVNDAHAQYPLTIDPFVQSARLTASDGIGGQYVGEDVASSADGSTLVVAGPNKGPGTAYVFVKPAGGWADMTETIGLTVPNNWRTDDASAVAISASGDTILVGVVNEAVYVYKRGSGGWGTTAALAATLKPEDNAGGFGTSIGISGETIVVGARSTKLEHEYQGAVYVFSEPSGGWHSTSEAARLTASDAATFDSLGMSVAIDGNTIAASAPQHGGTSGAVYVFARPAGGWVSGTQTAELTSPSAQYLGDTPIGVAISGQTIVAGSRQFGLGENAAQGAGFVWTMPSGGWHDLTSATAQLTASAPTRYDYLGRSAAIYGRTIVLGASAVESTKQQGVAYVYSEPVAGWADMTETQKLTASDATNGADFGSAVAIGANTILVGAEFAGGPGKAYVFSGPPSGPTVLSAPATAVTGTQATLNGTVNPNGEAIGDCHFDWGPTTAYGQSIPCATAPGAGAEPVAVSATLPGLSAGQDYHYRLVATGPGGTSYGSDEQLNTPAAPSVSAAAATGVTGTGATLNGAANPNGSAVSDCHFEWGATTAYGQTAACASAPGAGTEAVAVSATLTGLTSGATYHYRLVATGPGGTTYGADQQFVTAAGAVLGTQESSPPKTTPTAPLLPPARACLSARSFVIHVGLEHAAQLHIVSARVTVAGRLAAILKPGHLTVRIDLRGFPRGTFTVHIVARVRGGRTLTGTRTYHTCLPGRPGAKRHVL
jgi:hypothetical protein